MISLDPRVDKYILLTGGEQKVLEVHKHWMASAFPALRLVIGSVLYLGALGTTGPVYWVLVVIGLALCLQALWRMLEEFRDRFVITNQRVFRVSGNLSTERATMPLGRILDITVSRSAVGRMINYGHMVFESAAQIQGLNVIKYVKNIDEVEDIIHIVIAGDLPSPSVVPDEDDGT